MNWHYLTLKSQSISLPSPPIPLTHKGSYGRENYLKLKKNSALSKSRRGELFAGKLASTVWGEAGVDPTL